MSKTVQTERDTKLLLYQKNGKKKKENTGSRILAAFFSYAVFWALSCSYILIYESVFELDGAGWIYFVGAALFCLVCFLLYLKEHVDWKAHLMTAAMMLVWYLMFHQKIQSGCLMQLNDILEKAQVYYGIYFSQIPISEEVESGQMAVLFGMALLIWWSGAGFFYRKSAFWTFLPAGILCILDLLLGKAPDTSAVFLLAIGAAGCLPFCSGRRMDGRREIKSVQAKSGAVLLCTMLVLLLLANQFGGKKAAELVGRHDEMLSYQRDAEEWLKSGSFFSFFQQESGKVSNRAPEYDDTVVMNVTLDQKPEGVYYLRGYVGDTYQSGSWVNTGAKAFEDYAGSEGLEEESGREVLNFYYQTAKAAGKRVPEEMQIQYLKTGNHYAYLPYGADLFSLQGTDSDTNIHYSGDAMILKGGTDVLTMQGYLTGMDWGSNWDLIGNSAAVSDPAILESYENFLEQYLAVPSGLRQIHALGEELEQELEDYWEYYNSTVYVSSIGVTSGHNVKNYVSLDDGVNRYLAKNYSRNEIAVWLVRNEIAERTSYNLDLDKVPVRQDVTQYFLFGSRKGFCQHYASAGVLLLRKLGVPARYVTGYAVSGQEFTQQPDGSYAAAVKDRNAHAWVEYYEEGVGWIPVDMTEGANAQADQYRLPEKETNQWSAADQNGEDADHDTVQSESESQTEKQLSEHQLQDGGENQQENTPEDIGENSNDQTNIPEQKEENGKNSQTEEGTDTAGGISKATGNGKGSAVKGKGFAAILLIGAGAVVLMAELIHGVISYREKKRWKEFHQKNCRKAVKSISRHIYRLLEKSGKLKGYKAESDREYYKAAVELLGEKENPDGQEGGSLDQRISGEELTRYFEIVRRAFYSKEEMTTEDAAFCRSIYKKVRTVTKKF